jgi:hypothetical protein
MIAEIGHFCLVLAFVICIGFCLDLALRFHLADV